MLQYGICSTMCVCPSGLGILSTGPQGRLAPKAYQDLAAALAKPNHVLKEVSVTSEVVDAMRAISRAEVPDMPDRIVAATTAYLGVPVSSRDGKIHASNMQTIW